MPCPPDGSSGSAAAALRQSAASAAPEAAAGLAAAASPPPRQADRAAALRSLAAHPLSFLLASTLGLLLQVATLSVVRVSGPVTVKLLGIVRNAAIVLVEVGGAAAPAAMPALACSRAARTPTRPRAGAAGSARQHTGHTPAARWVQRLAPRLLLLHAAAHAAAASRQAEGRVTRVRSVPPSHRRKAPAAAVCSTRPSGHTHTHSLSLSSLSRVAHTVTVTTRAYCHGGYHSKHHDSRMIALRSAQRSHSPLSLTTQITEYLRDN